MTVTLHRGDVLEMLATLPADSVHCIVTSPPYWGLRDYGVDGQLGLEPTIYEYVAKMVEVGRALRRVLRPDGTLFLNMGDCYASNNCGGGSVFANGRTDRRTDDGGEARTRNAREATKSRRIVCAGLKPKDLVGQPWRVAFALQAGFSTCSGCGTELRSDLWPILNGHKVCISCISNNRTASKVICTEDGWYLRSDIIWAKPNPMPESVTDRPTKAHEYVFLLTKSAKYFCDQYAVREESNGNTHPRRKDKSFIAAKGRDPHDHRDSIKIIDDCPPFRNLRTVWTIATHPFAEAHFATFPPKLVETCIKAGTSAKGCCPACAAPWKRIVDRIDGGRSCLFGSSATTLGWSKTCDCTPSDPIPCTVLDPFAGSGTTLLVADRLQRNAIGIDLNTKYAEMAIARIEKDQGGLFADVEVV